MRGEHGGWRCAVLVVLGAAVTAHAQYGAWMQSAGAVEAEITLARIDTRTAFDDAGRTIGLYSRFVHERDGEMAANDLALLLAYGVNADLTLLGTVAYRQVSSQYANDSQLVQRPNAGLSDVYLAARYAIVTDPLVTSVQVGWKLPAADTGGPGAVALGSGSMDFDAALGIGTALPLRGIANRVELTGGYRFRGAGFGDEIFVHASLHALAVPPRVGVRLAYDAVFSQGKIASLDSLGGSWGFGNLNNVSWSRLGGGVFVRLSPKAELFVDLSTLLAGRNTFAGNTVRVGVVLTPMRDTPLDAR